MKQIPSYGVFTPSALMIHRYGTGESVASYLKRSLIYFDQLVFLPIGLGDMGGKDELISKQAWFQRMLGLTDAKLLKEVDKLILLDRHFFDDAEALHSAVMGSDSSDLWTGASSEKYIAFVENMVDNNPDIEDKWDAKKFFVGNIDGDYRLMRLLSQNFESCTALLSEVHEQAVIATLGSAIPNPDSVLRQVSDLNTFDFGRLSWEEIFRLRRDGFASDFRGKIADWVLQYGQSPDADHFRTQLDQIF